MGVRIKQEAVLAGWKDVGIGVGIIPAYGVELRGISRISSLPLPRIGKVPLLSSISLVVTNLELLRVLDTARRANKTVNIYLEINE